MLGRGHYIRPERLIDNQYAHRREFIGQIPSSPHERPAGGGGEKFFALLHIPLPDHPRGPLLEQDSPVEERLKFLIIPMGSAGDVHPLTWLARLLHARGHEVLLIVQAAAEAMAARSGVPYQTVGEAAEQEAIIRNPDLWHPRKAFPLVAQYMPRFARQLIPNLENQIDPGRTVMLAGNLAYGARIVGERRDVPVFSVDLQPSLMMSVEESPVVMAGTEWLPRAPRWIRRAFFGIGNWQVGRLMRPLEAVEREAGLADRAAKGLKHDWWHSRDGILCLYPAWFARKATDWPPQAVLTRFPLYDEAEVLKPDPALDAFLTTGDPPVIITPGSANAHATDFLREAAAGVTKAGRRGLIATRYPEQVPPGLPPTIQTFEYIPFGQVFPRAAAVIHHGGIGTTAQCFAAGIPQLIMPMAHDQPDNASRIRKFGVGDYLYPRHFKAARIAQTLQRLLASPIVRQACALYREKARDQISPEEMTDLLESLAEQALRIRQINGAGVPA
jgi:UDP:flavonoid glycosyltransferase YjiC (YdhE family)